MTGRRVLIAAGGTGGHVFPALAVAQALRHQGWHAEWVGSDRGLEARVIPAAGFGLHILKFSGVRGRGLLALLSLPLRLISALTRAMAITMRARPEVVVAFGGYVTFPIGLIAWLQRIPLCVHEQNAVMGTANRWLARIARSVMISFPGTRFAPAGATLVGNPVRDAICALPEPSMRYAQHTGPLRVLVVGGSLGASALNTSVPKALQLAVDAGASWEIWHQTGVATLPQVQSDYASRGLTARCAAFIDEMPAAYQWADLLICRAGASTVTEVAAVGVAAIFVPLPSAIDDHQTANARNLSDAQAAWTLAQSDTLALQLADVLKSATRDTLCARAVRARALAKPEATQQVVAVVRQAVQGETVRSGVRE